MVSLTNSSALRYYTSCLFPFLRQAESFSLYRSQQQSKSISNELHDNHVIEFSRNSANFGYNSTYVKLQPLVSDKDLSV